MKWFAGRYQILHYKYKKLPATVNRLKVHASIPLLDYGPLELLQWSQRSRRDGEGKFEPEIEVISKREWREYIETDSIPINGVEGAAVYSHKQL